MHFIKMIHMYLNDECAKLIKSDVALSEAVDLGLFDMLAGMKYKIPNEDPDAFKKLYSQIDDNLKTIQKIKE